MHVRGRLLLKSVFFAGAAAALSLCLAAGAALLAASGASPAAGSAITAEPYDLLILNGRVLDGAGNPWRRADVAVSGGRIARLGSLEHARARRRIDAAGRFVTPGFIDLLGQSEYTLLVDGRGLSKVAQGITTELTGEGLSPAPHNDETRRAHEHAEERLGLRIDWVDLEGYYARLERQGLGLNLGTFVGAEQVRRIVLGELNEAPTPQQLDDMVDQVVASMRQGAFGVSSSLIYPPGSYAGMYELVSLAEAAGRLGGIYISHIRNESDGIDDALIEAFEIGRLARVPVEIWHLKIAGRQNWGDMKRVVGRIEEARSGGLDVKANLVPYTASATTLSACVPPWAREGGTEAYLARLRDPETRARLKREIGSRPPAGWDNAWYSAGGAEGIVLASVATKKNRPLQGKRLSEIARERGADPLDVLLDLILEEKDRAGGIYFEMSEEDIRTALLRPWVSIVTNSPAVSPDGVLGQVRPHPRAYGSFPRILGRYVREEALLSWEEAVRRMTSLPASKVGLRNRGLLREGYWADIVIFDPETVADRATFEEPARLPVGIETVLVNGEIVMEQGRHTGRLPGRILRGPAYAGSGR
ncbi:MAG: D-aminoacylase [Acidobacteriota bacterium]